MALRRCVYLTAAKTTAAVYAARKTAPSIRLIRRRETQEIYARILTAARIAVSYTDAALTAIGRRDAETPRMSMILKKILEPIAFPTVKTFSFPF